MHRKVWCTSRDGKAGSPRSPRRVSSFRLKHTIGLSGCSSCSFLIVGSSWHEAPSSTYIPAHSATTASPPPDCLKTFDHRPSSGFLSGAVSPPRLFSRTLGHGSASPMYSTVRRSSSTSGSVMAIALPPSSVATAPGRESFLQYSMHSRRLADRTS